LEHLQKVTQEFVRRAAKAKGLAQSTIDSSGGKIFTFGSYALGAFNPASDIDTLLAAPKHIMVDDFFQHFPPTFREMSSPEDIAEFNPVPTAYVPIIKMKFRGVSIDLLFVSLPSKISIPPGAEFNLLDKQLLRGLDDQSMRSVNGTRVCKEILDSVPQHTPFRHALRAVKLWAEREYYYC
jgi:poly(A) polymerase